MRTLYQFPISHYCEKTRWHLDHKGLDYRVDNLFPGFHRLKSQRLAGIATLWAISRACRAARNGLRWCWRRRAHG